MIKQMLILKCLTTAGLIIAAASLSRPVTLSSQPEYPNRDLCEEVAHELNDAFVDGRISRSDATRIIDNCFETFV